MPTIHRALGASTAWLGIALLAAGCGPARDNPETASLGGSDTAALSRDTAGATIAPAEPNVQMQSVLSQLDSLNPKPIEMLSAPEARKQPTPADAVKALLQKQQGKPPAPEPVAKVENRTIPGPEGKIPVRIYWPEGEGPFPVVVYYHGGGWVIADLDTYDASARALANAAKAVVISSHYRQGPEHKFPAAHEDAFAAYQWALKNARSLQGDPARVAVAGESAGGNLAAAVSLMAREQNVQLPVHQVLVYPITSASLDFPSVEQHANAKPLNKAMLPWFADKYLTEAAKKDPRIDLLAADVKGLPATTVVLAEIDPLRSEGELFAKRLEDGGVEVSSKVYTGVTHEFFGMGAVVNAAKTAVEQAASGLKKGFEAPRETAAR